MSSYAHFNNPMLHRPIELAQYTSIAFTERLAQAGIAPSIGSVADAYDCQSLRTGSREDRVAPAEAV